MSAMEEKMEEVKTVAIYNNIQVTNLYANCIEDKKHPGV